MHHGFKKGQVRTCNCIVKFLEDVGTAPFSKIKEHVNSKLKYGVTSSRLGNILSKYPDFEKVGMTITHGEVGGYIDQRYPISIWKLSPLE